MSVAMVNVLRQIGDTIALHLPDESCHPRYQRAFISTMVFALVALACAMRLKVFLKQEKACQPSPRVRPSRMQPSGDGEGSLCQPIGGNGHAREYII